jgi:periplasmic protein TonB
MHDSSLPESADITPRHPSERPKLRPLIGVPDAVRESRRMGATVSALSHLLIVLLLLLPALFHREITDALTEGAGGPGAAGGGGGGRGGSPIVPERIQRYQLPPPQVIAKPTPSVLPPLVKVPEVVKPPEEKKPEPVPPTPEEPKPSPPNPTPAVASAAPVAGPGAGAGTGKDEGPGNGPGTGGGVGSGVGTGTGSSVGSGTGGGNAAIFPPSFRVAYIPPNGLPRRLRGKAIMIELEVDETGKVLKAEFSPRSGDRSYDEQFLTSLREQLFRPAIQNGIPVRFTYRYEMSF